MTGIRDIIQWTGTRDLLTVGQGQGLRDSGHVSLGTKRNRDYWRQQGQGHG